MKNKNLESALVEVREALFNFGAQAQNIELDWKDQFDAIGAYNDMVAWFNYYVEHSDMKSQRLQYIEHDRDEVDNEAAREKSYAE